MKQDERGFVIDFKSKVVPLNKKGDPAFSCLEDITTQFTAEEVTHMVNRYLYQTYYQRDVHRQRARTEAERLTPIKEKIRELFNVPYTKATDAQIEAAIKALAPTTKSL